MWHHLDIKIDQKNHIRYDEPKCDIFYTSDYYSNVTVIFVLDSEVTVYIDSWQIMGNVAIQLRNSSYANIIWKDFSTSNLHYDDSQVISPEAFFTKETIIMELPNEEYLPVSEWLPSDVTWQIFAMPWHKYFTLKSPIDGYIGVTRWLQCKLI